MEKISFMTLADARAHDAKAFDKVIYEAVNRGVDLVGARSFAESLSRPIHFDQTIRNEMQAA